MKFVHVQKLTFDGILNGSAAGSSSGSTASVAVTESSTLELFEKPASCEDLPCGTPAINEKEFVEQIHPRSLMDVASGRIGSVVIWFSLFLSKNFITFFCFLDFRKCGSERGSCRLNCISESSLCTVSSWKHWIALKVQFIWWCFVDLSRWVVDCYFKLSEITSNVFLFVPIQKSVVYKKCFGNMFFNKIWDSAVMFQVHRRLKQW